MDQKKDFLQSENWLRFQESAGHEVIRISDGDFSVGGIIHKLPIAGKYLYAPRYPSRGISSFQFSISKLLAEARLLGCGWVRVEPETEVERDEILRFAQNDKLKTVKAPHDMQPRETFVIDILGDESELLREMKSKTRYNIRLAEKKGVRVFQTTEDRYRKAFIDLVTGTADRKGITPHPRSYYEAMLKTFFDGSDIGSTGFSSTLFVAEHDGDILGANLIVFFGDIAVYLHGGSSNVKREYMAPFLLQWEAIKEAKRRGCSRYDFGGVRFHSKIESRKSSTDSWEGITRFKLGFSPATESAQFPGCYDVILSPWRYELYRFFSLCRSWIVEIRKTL